MLDRKGTRDVQSWLFLDGEPIDYCQKRHEYLPNIHSSAAPLQADRKSACGACRLRITIAQRLLGNTLVLGGFARRSGEPWLCNFARFFAR
jgi:hypothetical protein